MVKKDPMKRILQRIFALLLIFLHLLDLSYPRAYALTGGPSQPEVQHFEPVGTSDLVDLFSGDFNYNIPLMDVGGYPINISYHSGVSMDQEASWVGLGWNINPGVINRNMRGLPDDFAGDSIMKEMNLKSNYTIGVDLGLTNELFGISLLKGGFNVGLDYNSYTGMGASWGLNVTRSYGSGSTGLTWGLGLGSSTKDGMTITPSVSFSSISKRMDQNNEVIVGTSTYGLSAPINSRAGLKQMSFTKSFSVSQEQSSPVRGRGAFNLMDGGYTFDFGTPTYYPTAQPFMHTFSGTLRLSVGTAIIGLHPGTNISGYFSIQNLAVNKMYNPAYGYINSTQGQRINYALLDFNREKDGEYMVAKNATLPLTNFTYDLYSASAHGMNESFRAMRNDIGYVYDSYSASLSNGGSIGVELGAGGNSAHTGVDVKLSPVNSRSGAWRKDNEIMSTLNFQSQGADDTYESVYFKSSSERSVDQNSDWVESYGGYQPVYIGIERPGTILKPIKFKTKAVAKYYKNPFEYVDAPKKNVKNYRDARNQVMNYLKNSELDKFGLLGEINTGHKPHHIGEISILKEGGERYYYCIPAYNNFQKEVTFATGASLTNKKEALSGDCMTGLVDYNHNTSTGDNSVENDRGIDHYFNAVTTPEYAHSYLLSAVVSSDYSDIDSVRGPSDGDMGSYTRFYYTKIDDYKWRTPFNKAFYNEGLKADKHDDKASYIYGEKEIWYMDSIVTKNYIAIFHKSDRRDGFGASENGIIDETKSQQKLDSISLYSRPDYMANQANAVPLKRVHFEYTYELCPNVPNNNGRTVYTDYDGDGNFENVNANKGKLTLKRIYFTYQGVQKTRFSPYEFDYSAFNPNYDIKGNDRWGNYKENASNVTCHPFSPITNAENPYTVQDKTIEDQWAGAWVMKGIHLPSGGYMKMEYESDDYAYVQHKPAMQMARVVGVTSDLSNVNVSHDFGEYKEISLSEGTFDSPTRNKYMIFELQDDIQDIDLYFKDVDQLYFKFLMNFHKEGDEDSLYDYVPGYAKIIEKGIIQVSGTNYGYVKLRGEDLDDYGTQCDVVPCYNNPISVAAINFGRMHLHPYMYDLDFKDDGIVVQTFKALASSFNNIGEFITGPSEKKYSEGRGRKFISGKSWFRVNNVNGHKLGGGLRVKKLTVSDEWSDMTQGNHQTMEYGQEYSYNLENGVSSGVAAYEPWLGAEENPFRQPVFTTQRNVLAPDFRFYKEEPYGESFFPGASVGYSRVTVQNIDRSGVTKHATGKMVSEFYTHKDFPVITKRTDVVSIMDKTNPLSISNFFKINYRNYLTTTQGYYVELNDMHGKPKKQSVYAEGSETPITFSEYYYKTDLGVYPGTYRLNNNAEVIDENGDVSKKDIGIFFDMVADMRESSTTAISPGVRGNLDAFYIPPFIIGFVPAFLPSYTSQKTRFRSAVTTKVVYRFGLLDKTVAYDGGSEISTRNKAYDARSGEVLLTEVTNGFNDPIYHLKFPARWYYKQMGHAYKNIGVQKKGLVFISGVATVANADKYFSIGDELMLSDGEKAWVSELTSTTVTAMTKYGNPVHGTLDVKVLKSGRKNMIASPMAELTTMSNPLSSLKTNLYTQVLSASAIEYTDEWRAYCDCLQDKYVSGHSNPYFIGTKGNWQVKKSQTYLTDRVQSLYNDNTNIRKDGTFTSYSPYYKIQSDQTWSKDPRSWTFTTELTEFSALGQELENRDALGRYSSAMFGYNGTMALAVASNTRHKELGFDSFEDYDYNLCMDGHFKFVNDKAKVTSEASHSGRKSIKVSNGTPVIMSKDIQDCTFGGCHLKTDTSAISMTPFNFKVSVSGGQEPYSFDYSIISGAPILAPLDATSFGLSGSGYYVKFIITDAKGCSVIQTVTR